MTIPKEYVGGFFYNLGRNLANNTLNRRDDLNEQFLTRVHNGEEHLMTNKLEKYKEYFKTIVPFENAARLPSLDIKSYDLIRDSVPRFKKIVSENKTRFKEHEYEDVIDELFHHTERAFKERIKNPVPFYQNKALETGLKWRYSKRFFANAWPNRNFKNETHDAVEKIVKKTGDYTHFRTDTEICADDYCFEMNFDKHHHAKHFESTDKMLAHYKPFFEEGLNSTI